MLANPRPAQPDQPDAVRRVLVAVRDYLIDNPGAVVGKGVRRRYGDGFRALVLQLLAPDGPGAALTIEQAGEATGVPIGTIKDWLRIRTEPTKADRAETEVLEAALARPGLHPAGDSALRLVGAQLAAGVVGDALALGGDVDEGVVEVGVPGRRDEVGRDAGSAQAASWSG